MMEKRRRGSYSYSCSKGKTKDMFKGEDASTDRISMLPDALLVCILSLLTFKESVATCLLSRRWRYVWTLVPKLDFDGFESLTKVKMARKKKLAIHEERSKYVRWVDSVIALHKSCAIEEFRVYFNLNKHYQKHIDNWINYALARKVKRLELDLTGSFRPCDWYTSPFIHSMERNNLIHFKYLEKISLNHVNVNGEDLEFFLRNCPLLQHLSVTESRELLSLKIIGPFPSLEHLEIIFCANLNYFEIRDANLVSLKFMGHLTQHFVLKNVPLLVEINYTGGCKQLVEFMFMSSGIIPQLEKFRFALDFYEEETKMLFCSAVKMSNLKQMTIRIVLEEYMLMLTDILRASPCLETFVLEVPNFATAPAFKKRELQKVDGSYTHLKEVKIRGYCGTMSDLEFVMHLLENADALEKIVVDPRRPFDTIYETFADYKFDTTSNRKENKARCLAKKQLVGKLPPRINLHIL